MHADDRQISIGGVAHLAVAGRGQHACIVFERYLACGRQHARARENDVDATGLRIFEQGVLPGNMSRAAGAL